MEKLPLRINYALYKKLMPIILKNAQYDKTDYNAVERCFGRDGLTANDIAFGNVPLSFSNRFIFLTALLLISDPKRTRAVKCDLLDSVLKVWRRHKKACQPVIDDLRKRGKISKKTFNNFYDNMDVYSRPEELKHFLASRAFESGMSAEVVSTFIYCFMFLLKYGRNKKLRETVLSRLVKEFDSIAMKQYEKVFYVEKIKI